MCITLHSKLQGIVLLQGILPVVLLIASFASEGLQATQNDRVCSAEEQVQMSMLAGIKYHHMLTATKRLELEREHVETEKRLAEVKTEVNNTIKEERELENQIHNMTTPEIEELEAMNTCESSIPIDCCEV